MDELWQRNGKKSKSKSIKNNSLDLLTSDSTSNMPVSKPDWSDWKRIPSKNVAMSEEDFEEAIRTLALKIAEKGMELGDSGKGSEAFKFEEWNLLTEYISVVSPDRKAACENYIRNPYDNSNYTTIYGSSGQNLMTCVGGIWAATLTSEELSRYSQFYGIYMDTIREYEAENGQIPSKGKSKSANPYKDMAEYRSYNVFNALA